MSIIQRPQKIVIIGGGATGTGIAREAAERGYQVTLIERGHIGQGTSSHFHGVLHSGARYAVKDPQVAAECYLENQHLRKLIPTAITATGGLFLTFTEAEVRHAKTLLIACAEAGIPIKEIAVAQALQAEPHLNPTLKRAYTVPDGYIDGIELMRLNRHAALEAEHPAKFLTNHDVVGLQTVSHHWMVTVKDRLSAKLSYIDANYVINASGVWAGQVAQLANVKLEMVYDKGTMVVFNERFSTAVLNRCRPEADGDLLVPHKQQSIMGTTARLIKNPDRVQPTKEEVALLVREGSMLVPELAQTAVLKSYAGVRPLLAPKRRTGNNRGISRSFQVIDHSAQGANNFISVVGGKVTLYRKMAAAAVDIIDQKDARR